MSVMIGRQQFERRYDPTEARLDYEIIFVQVMRV
jgi:hypothetical protein